MNNYKLILNFNRENQNILFFDRLTKNKIQLMKKSDNYILATYESFFKNYDTLDLKIQKQDINFLKENYESLGVSFIYFNLKDKLKDIL